MLPDYMLDPPDEPEQRPTCMCTNCGNNIMHGDIYYDMDSGPWCAGCIGFREQIA